jgi:CheY-like chemotaxis protein
MNNASAKSLLVVDDDLITLEMMGLFLGDASYFVHSAPSIEKALEIAAKNSIDLVISDLGLPDGSGLDLMRTLRDLYQVKGIAVTGYGEESSQARDAGFVDFLTKPVDVEQLLSVVRNQVNN